MTVSDPRCDFRTRLLQQLAAGRSLRQIAADYPECVKHGVLGKIAKHGIFPKDRAILKALGIGGRKRSEVEKGIAKMAKNTTDAVVRHKPVKEEYLAVEVKK